VHEPTAVAIALLLGVAVAPGALAAPRVADDLCTPHAVLVLGRHQWCGL